MPFWFLNGTLTTEGIREQMVAANASGFTGVAPLPTARKSEERPGTTPLFLTPDYFDRLQDILDMAVELDMKVILYDDNDYPSGMAGGKLGELYPQHTMKRLDIVETEFTGPGTFSQSFDAIELMAAVAMHTETKERIEISDFAKNGVLKWVAPEGTWTIMLFPLVKDGWHTAFPVVDYLDPVAVEKKIGRTYDRYAEKFSSYFTVIP